MKNIPEYHYKHNKKSNTLILSASDIEKHASDFLQEYSKSNTNYSFSAPQATPIEEIIENYCGITTDYQTFGDSNILGMTAFSSGLITIKRDDEIAPYRIEKGAIIISNELAENEKQEGRYLYTLAHEFGHCFYHRILFETPDSSNQPSLFDEKPSEILAICCHRDNIENLDKLHNKDWTEWQADYFASCILMPREAVHKFWKLYIKESDFVFGEEPKPFLSDMRWMEKEWHIGEFVKKFNVSCQAAKIRLKKLNYI